MSEPSKLNISVTHESHGRKTHISRVVTLEGVINWIKGHQFDDYTTNGLIEIASKYPNQALPSFRKNFNVMIARVRQKRKTEQGVVSNVKEEPVRKEPEVSLDQAFESFTKQEAVEEVVEKAVEVNDIPEAPQEPEDWR